MLTGPFKQTGVGGDIKPLSVIINLIVISATEPRSKTRKGVRFSISLKNVVYVTSWKFQVIKKMSYHWFLWHLIYKVESGCVCLCVCLCVCVSGIEIHTVGPILTKFGMGAQLYKGQVIGYVLAPRVDPRGQGGPKQGLESIYSRNRDTRKKIYET